MLEEDGLGALGAAFQGNFYYLGVPWPLMSPFGLEQQSQAFSLCAQWLSLSWPISSTSWVLTRVVHHGAPSRPGPPCVGHLSEHAHG